MEGDSEINHKRIFPVESPPNRRGDAYAEMVAQICNCASTKGAGFGIPAASPQYFDRLQ